MLRAGVAWMAVGCAPGSSTRNGTDQDSRVLVCFFQHPALQAGPMMAANAVEETQQWHRYAGRE
jgi:hypothetical protein